MIYYYMLNPDHTTEACHDVAAWIDWFKTADRRVGYTAIGNKVVSTVFLGIDHACDPSAPVLFETMVFEKDDKDSGDKRSGGRNWYATWQEAQEGHNKAVSDLTSDLPRG